MGQRQKAPFLFSFKVNSHIKLLLCLPYFHLKVSKFHNLAKELVRKKKYICYFMMLKRPTHEIYQWEEKVKNNQRKT